VDEVNPPVLRMLVYELYVLNKKKGYELIGVLPERRKNQMRITKQSVIKWGRMLLDDNDDSEEIFFKVVKTNDTCIPMTHKS